MAKTLMSQVVSQTTMDGKEVEIITSIYDLNISNGPEAMRSQQESVPAVLLRSQASRRKLEVPTPASQVVLNPQAARPAERSPAEVVLTQPAVSLVPATPSKPRRRLTVK